MNCCPKCETPMILEEEGHRLYMTCPYGCRGIRYRIRRRRLEILDGEILDWPSSESD